MSKVYAYKSSQEVEKWGNLNVENLEKKNLTEFLPLRSDYYQPYFFLKQTYPHVDWYRLSAGQYVSKALKMFISFDLAILLLETHVKERIKRVPKDAYTNMHIKMLVMMWREGRLSKCPITRDQLSKLWSLPTVGHYATIEHEGGGVCLPAGLPDCIKSHYYPPSTLYLSLQLSWFNYICFCMLT